MNFLNPDSNSFQRLSRVTDLMILNLLWLLCSLPVVTLGASTTALYSCTMKLVRQRERGILAMFFGAFRQNWKQGCILTLLLLAAAAFLIVDIHLCQYVETMLQTALVIVLVVLAVECAAIFSYAFALTAQFENSLWNTLKNARALAFRHLGKSFVMILLNAIPFALLMLMPGTFIISIPVWVVIGVAAIAYFNSKLLVRIFDRYSDI